MPFRCDRAWAFAVPPMQLWGVLSDTASYPRWWPWLDGFDGEPLAEGSRATCVIRAPLPYVMKVTVEAVRVVPASLLHALVAGDLAGEARLEVKARGDGSELRLAWDVEVQRPLLRVLERVARPLLEWGQDWVIDRGMAQFQEAVSLEAEPVQRLT